METVQQSNMSWKQKPRTAELRAALLNKLVEAITNLNSAHTEESKVSERKIRDSALQFELATFMKSKSEDQFTKVMMIKITDTTQIAAAMKQILTGPHKPISSAQLQQDLQTKLNQLRQKQRQEQIKLESTQRDQPMADPLTTRQALAGLIDLTHSSDKLSVPDATATSNTNTPRDSSAEVPHKQPIKEEAVKEEPMDQSTSLTLPAIRLTIASPIAPPGSSSNMHFSNKIFDLLNHEDRPAFKMEVEKINEKPTQSPGIVLSESFERGIMDDRVKSVFELAKDTSAQAPSFLRVNSAMTDEYSVVIAHASPTNKTEEAELVQICAMCVTTNKVFMAHVMPTGVIDKDVKVKHRLSRKNLAELNARPFSEVGAQFSSWLAAQGQNIVIVVPRPASFESRLVANYRSAGLPVPAFSCVALAQLFAVVAPALVSPSARSLTALCIQFSEAPPQPRNSTQIVDCCFRLLKRVVKGYTSYPSVANFVLSTRRLVTQPHGLKRRLSHDKLENPAVPHVAKRKFIGYAVTNTQTHTTTVYNSKQDLHATLQHSIQGAVSPAMLRQWLDKGTVPNQPHLLVTKLKLSDKDTA